MRGTLNAAMQRPCFCIAPSRHRACPITPTTRFSMKQSSIFALASTLLLALGAAVPLRARTIEFQNSSPAQNRSEISVFALVGSSNPSQSHSDSVLAVRDTMGRIEAESMVAQQTMETIKVELELAYPDAVESGPDALGYIWKLIDEQWVLICNLQESAYVHCEDEWVVVQLVTEMGT